MIRRIMWYLGPNHAVKKSNRIKCKLITHISQKTDYMLL